MRLRVLLGLCIFATADLCSGQGIELPERPLEGRIVFEEKGCIECHALGGYGGDLGPDLSRDHFFGSFMDLAATIWNHTPEMDRKFRERQVERPNLSEKELLNLAGFIYYLKYLGEPGSVSNGARLIKSKGCLACHGRAGESAPDFALMDQNASALNMVQSMWNHGPEMSAEMKDMDIEFPSLTGENIADMAAYIQMAATDRSDIRMSPGSPRQGADIFVSKGCDACHSVTGVDEKLGPDLSEFDMRQSVTEIASDMWNHSQLMAEYIENEGLKWPVFEGKEMADLLSYLYFLGFSGEPGNAEDGAYVFENKGCAWCHETGGDGVGRDPATFPRLRTPVRMVQLMWNHAAEMEDEILIRNEKWPRLSEREMQDLYEYLRQIKEE